jgi:hypothetical protein
MLFRSPSEKPVLKIHIIGIEYVAILTRSVAASLVEMKRTSHFFG